MVLGFQWGKYSIKRIPDESTLSRLDADNNSNGNEVEAESNTFYKIIRIEFEKKSVQNGGKAHYRTYVLLHK